MNHKIFNYDPNLKAFEKDFDLRKANFEKKRAELLVSAGYPANYTEIQYECALCGDTGVVDYRMCKCLKDKLVMAGLERSGMYEVIKTQSFDNFDLNYYSGESRARIRAILDITKSYADNFNAESGASLIMMGNTALGKTHLTSAMGKTVIEQGNDVYYSSAVDMIADFESERFSNNKNEGDLTEKYFSCDLLIIDDLGTEVVNQFSTSCLYSVINSRLIRKKATIINTNYSRDDMRKKYTDRIASRIFGEYTVLPFMGTDIRELKIRSK
jgi:DNA replication protein DnaC